VVDIILQSDDAYAKTEWTQSLQTFAVVIELPRSLKPTEKYLRNATQTIHWLTFRHELYIRWIVHYNRMFFTVKSDPLVVDEDIFWIHKEGGRPFRSCDVVTLKYHTGCWLSCGQHYLSSSFRTSGGTATGTHAVREIGVKDRRVEL
jgi:hypothetical protein